MNEKDRSAVEKLLDAHSFPVAFTNRRTADINGRLRDAVVNLLTATRKEEREAAFKVICVDCAEGDTPILDQQARWYYHGLGKQEVGCSSSKLRIATHEAAASTKGEGEWLTPTVPMKSNNKT